jgi:ribosomal protein L11 methyltransferase
LNSWFQLTVHVPASESDRISGFLFDLGSSGLEVDDTSKPDSVMLTAYFPIEAGRETVLANIGAELSNPSTDGRLTGVSDVPDEDWGAKWRDHFEPIFPTERIVVHPPWCEVTAPENGFAVAIEPKTAFGTGSHPTTKMALLALEKIVNAGDRVLDVGTGSGILSIAAMGLGAKSALALDTDPVAAQNVNENVLLNNVSGISVETRGVSGEDSNFDVTVANIIRSVLTPMLPLLAHSVRGGGHVVLGGLLDREESEFAEAARDAGLTIVEITREAEWIGLITGVEK